MKDEIYVIFVQKVNPRLAKPLIAILWLFIPWFNLIEKVSMGHNCQFPGHVHIVVEQVHLTNLE